MPYPAHIRNNSDGTQTVQTVEAHCENTAACCRRILEPMGLGAAGELLGLLHDMGKYTAAFTDYITRLSRGEAAKRGSVNHTFAAVQFLFARYAPPGATPMRRSICEMLAFASGAHHGQFDGVDADGSSGFFHRLRTRDNDYEAAKEAFIAHCAGYERLDALFAQAERELTAQITALNTPPLPEGELLFSCAMLCRLLLSALIDGDRRDTMEFMQNVTLSNPPDDLRPIWTERLRLVEERLDRLPRLTPVDAVRRQISDQCRALGRMPRGVYRLSVPTGGGKTLASLRAALAHAAHTGASRLIFVTPLLSVLEQNAAVVRDWIEDDSLILEHHSNAARPPAEDRELCERQELLSESWNAPIVITTLVQLLNTLFDGRTTCIRRMQALRGSVLVLDEVQSVPKRMLTLFNLAMNFLSGVCGATVILCSATQPSLDAAAHPLRNARDLVPYDPALWTPFKRTQIITGHAPSGGYTEEELAAFAARALEEHGSVLLICNKKAQALALYRLLRDAGKPVFHLSTAMCMANRIDVLGKLMGALGKGEKVICVSTQLVEAGVDFSFGCVIRLFAGLDNVIQAAGRCNRSGEKGHICPVYLVKLKGEKLSRLPDILQAQAAAERLLSTYSGDLTSDEAVARYYRYLYTAMPRGAQDDYLPALETSIFELLSHNNKSRGLCPVTDQPAAIFQAFKTAGDAFCVFDSATVDVLVPFETGKDVIAELNTERAKYDLGFCKEQLDRGKRFTVSLFPYQLEALQKMHGVHSLCDGLVLALAPPYYDNDTGIVFNKNLDEFLET